MSRYSADVIVIGLGAFGSATLYQLAKRGARVIGIDQFAPPHDRGSSHGNTRITRLAAGEGADYIPFIKRSHAIWQELEEQTGKRLYHRTGGLIIGAMDGTSEHHGKPNFVEATIANARRFEIAHEVLSASEVTHRFPQFQTRGDEVGYLEHDSGVLFPEACVDAQISEAQRLGASVRLNEKVVAIESGGNGVVVRTISGEYAAAKAVLTTGAWIPGMTGGAFASNLRVRRQTLHWFETTEPALYSPSNSPIFIWMHGAGDYDYMYGFPMVDGVPGVKVATEQYETTCDPDTFERTVRPEESCAMFDAHVAGRLRSVRRNPVHAAACLYTVSTDAGFLIDRSREMDNVTVVSACSGHGFKNSAGLGERLAMQALGEDASSLRTFSVERFEHRDDVHV